MNKLRIKGICSTKDCSEALRPPIKSCVKGRHSVCVKCEKTLELCPKCGTKFTKCNNELLNAIIKFIPFTCRSEGCQLLVKLQNHDHESWCGYKSTSCKVQHCDWVGRSSAIKEHVLTKHHKDTLVDGEGRVPWRLAVQDPNCDPLDYFKPMVICEQFIWAHFVNSPEKEEFKVHFFCVPNNGKIKTTFSINLTLKTSKGCLSFIFNMKPKTCLNEKKNLITWFSTDVANLVNIKKIFEYTLEINKIKTEKRVNSVR